MKNKIKRGLMNSTFKMCLIFLISAVPMASTFAQPGGGSCSGINDFFLSGGGTTCNGGTKELFVGNSQSNVQYQLKTLAGSNVGGLKWGNGGNLSFGTHGVGTYTVTGKKSGCTQSGIGSISITNVVITASMSVSGSVEYCPYESTTFTAYPSGANGYQWYLNNSPISGATLATFSPAQAGSYKVEVTVGTCSDVSITTTIIAAPVATPAVSIRVRSGSYLSICPGGSITFEVYNLQSQGSSPSYQWKKNGLNVGSNSTSYAANNFNDNDVITCTMTTSLSYCISKPADTSNSLTVDVKNSPNFFLLQGEKTVCYGGVGELYIDNSEVGVSYQLQNNSGGPLGSAQSGNGAKVSFGVGFGLGTYKVLATKSGCSIASSNTASISYFDDIAASFSGAPEFCASNPPLFTAHPSGASYQWYLNNSPISGATLETFTPSQAGDYQVSVTVGSCSKITAIQTMTAIPQHTPTISIQLAPGYDNEICQGESVIFAIADSTYAGSNPIYQWHLNGADVGDGSPSITLSNFVDGANNISCTMTSSAILCLTSAIVVSSNITVTENELPTVTGGAGYELFYDDQIHTLANATPTGGNWAGNGVVNNGFESTIAGVGSHTLTYSYTDPLTSCTSSDTRVLIVLAVPEISVNGSTDLELAGTRILSVPDNYDFYQWDKDSQLINGATTNALSIDQAGVYSVTIATVNSFSPVTLFKSIDDLLTKNELNFIKTIVFKEATNEISGQLDETKVDLQVSYFDGLGRPVQVNQWRASPEGEDIIQPIAYDDYGRQHQNFLPYVSNDTHGGYDPNALNEMYSLSNQYQFYQNTTAVATDTRPFSETVYEPSPLNRAEKQYGPGEDWKVSGDEKPISYSYEINTTTDGVKLWTLTENMPVTTTDYIAGELTKNITTDEENHQVIEFTDKLGRTILKRVQAPDDGDANTADWADTYYVYDDFGNLRFVLPPEAINNLHQYNN